MNFLPKSNLRPVLGSHRGPLGPQKSQIKLTIASFLSPNQMEHTVFPLNESNHLMIMRNPERYVINKFKTQRHQKSAVPFLQKLLNDDYANQKKDLSKLLRVNNGVINNAPITF